MKNKLIRVVGLLSTLMILSGSVLALGVGPTKIKIHEALKGEEYKKTTKLFNMGKSESTFLLEATGDIAPWITFYSEKDLDTPVTNVVIESNSSLLILLKFNIPKDTANGNYTATVYVQSIPRGGSDSGAGQKVTIKIPVDISIEVIGDQILKGDVKSITVRDAEINYPLRIKVEFQNTGNVVAKPKIKVDILKDKEVVNSFMYSSIMVNINSRDIIPIEWDTGEMKSGDYTGEVSVLLGDELVDKKELAFKLLPIGTLTRAGYLTDLSYEGELLVGSLIKILSAFRNTGEIDTKAKFVGEVYHEGNLVDAINSEELLIHVKEKDTLTTYMKINAPGEYAIKGHVLYEGKKTEIKELSFLVPEEQVTTSTIQSTNAPSITTTGETTAEQEKQGVSVLWIAVILAVLAIIVILVLRKGK